MGSTQNCISWLRSIQLIICFLLMILVLNLTEVRFMAQGRTISSQLIETTQLEGMTEDDNKVVKMMLIRARKIGSTPPRCDKRCNKCGHCEAVQVPVVPQLQNRNGKSHSFFASKRTKASYLKNIEYSRGDFISNYKPMSWKCRCGDLFFNP